MTVRVEKIIGEMYFGDLPLAMSCNYVVRKRPSEKKLEWKILTEMLEILLGREVKVRCVNHAAQNNMVKYTKGNMLQSGFLPVHIRAE